MPLTHNPIQPTELSWLDIGTDNIPSSTGREVIQRTNLATYLAGTYCIGFGRRDLLPLCVLWHKAGAYAYLKTQGNRESGGISKMDAGWCLCFAETLRDWLLDMPRFSMVAVEYGSEHSVNVPALLSYAIERLERGAVPEGGNMLLSALSGLSNEQGPDQEMETLAFIGVCCGVAFEVALNAQLHAASISKGLPDRIHMMAAQQAIRSDLGDTFAHTAAKAAQAFLNLRGKSGMEDVWGAMVETMCLNHIDTRLSEPPDNENPTTRRNRRWLNGELTEEIIEDRERVTSQDKGEAIGEVLQLCGTHIGSEWSSPVESALLSVAQYVEDEYMNFVPMTFMRPEAYELFNKTGHTLTLWDLSEQGGFENSWHHRYSDVPLHARAVTDRRLYGERGRFITYGALIHRGMTDQIQTLASMYGTHVLTWKLDVLRYSTLCLNDSQLSPYVVPATRMMVQKLVLASMAPRILNLPPNHPLGTVIAKGVFGTPDYPQFIEVQMHDNLTTAAVDDVMDLA